MHAERKATLDLIREINIVDHVFKKSGNTILSVGVGPGLGMFG